MTDDKFKYRPLPDVNYLTFSLGAPGDPEVARTVSNALAHGQELCREAAERKLDPSGLRYALATEHQALQAWPSVYGVNERADRMLKAARLQVRVNTLGLLNEMSAWEKADVAKAEEKRKAEDAKAEGRAFKNKLDAALFEKRN